MESIRVYIRVKPSNGKTSKLFNIINDEENSNILLNLKTGEKFSYGKQK